MLAAARTRRPLVFLLAAVCLVSAVTAAGSSSAASSTTTPSASTSLSLTTSYTPLVTTIRSGGNNITISTSVPVSTFNVTVTPTSTASASASSNSSAAAAAASASAEALRTLDTQIDPAFGVLGALLILTGLPSAFLGHKNRWTSFFLIGVYTFALVCFSLIIRFGVLQAVNPPTKAVRGLFMLACGVSGIAGGGIAIFFWQATRYFVGAWGGFVVALWIQCFRDGGLISPIGLRWILYIALGVIGFVLCTIPKIHYHVLLLSTSFVGATSVILGIDCFTTGDLKEFYVWNLGFTALFPKFTNNGIKFPVNQTMEIELGLIGAVSLMGIAVQFQVLKVLQRKLKEIKEAARRPNEELENRAALAFAELEKEKAEWDREHPALAKHGRMDSEFSSLLKDTESLSPSPRQRYQSGVSDFIVAPNEEMHRSTSKLLQSPGALPVLDLGLGIENDVPKVYIAESSKSPKAKDAPMTQVELEDLKRKEELLTEIQTIRKSIEILKTEATDPSSSSGSRHQSFTSRRTLSQDIGSLMPAAPAHLRPPRQADPRARVQSMELSVMSSGIGASIGRPTSAPLRDDDWDAYVRERKLLQPPSGVTPPIATTPISPTPRVPVSPAVEEALMKRHRIESHYSANGLEWTAADGARRPSPVQKVASTGHDIPTVLRTPHATHARSHSQGGVPVTILPPQKPAASRSPQPAETPVPWTTRTLTFEALDERHREKIRELQEPVTRAEKEQLEIAEAKARWERAKASEKQAVAKRQAEKAAAVSKDAAKQHKSGEPAGTSDKRKSRTMEQQQQPGSSRQHSRTLSADILAHVPGTASSKRMSTMKVEDWQKHQQDVELGFRPEEQRASRRRSAVPFPETHDRPADGRDARRLSRTPRDMLS
ncbi:uncharacterized protein C8Q71DRAFT_796479 [Rhodofomes roseus]|uniref:TM7S3/TM198-like domain-containing protein n=1 Tax=Rhodofomes roseus TaxID=34475 RepID=A0ABQ8KH23_9APHY|nr:uncharacterized protein C8Q71DRAFT_796479 [Rhodofomes roseus]KAH9837044.1 hypothetical protein C8Q71DRAFT_796479 [Rhodofomes roseus]